MVENVEVEVEDRSVGGRKRRVCGAGHLGGRRRKVCGTGICTGLGRNPNHPSRNLHSCTAACTARVQRSGTFQPSGSS